MSPIANAKVVIRLSCCGYLLMPVINERAIIAGEPHEVRKTIECPQCHRIVILEFSVVNGVLKTEQELST